ncbi:hypothetical protein L2E82_31507 [Cichorium intybus]|uniref:Uncharacterized protein n=1 Tax=Cichorium intybus TaxID=13427 RepID=A0ACB9BIE4_CICIN|nr:hypothetical protein L2E82_31507 [Cichorium intybus]
MVMKSVKIACLRRTIDVKVNPLLQRYHSWRLRSGEGESIKRSHMSEIRARESGLGLLGNEENVTERTNYIRQGVGLTRLRLGQNPCESKISYPCFKIGVQ